MDRYCKSGIMQTGKSLFLAAGMVALIGMALGVGDTAEAAIASEPGFGLAGTVHRGNGAPLQTANPAGMPATVADFLAGEGRDAATVNSLRVGRQMSAGGSGVTVIDFTQQLAGLAVYGARVRAVFNADGDLIAMSENLATAGPVMAPGIGARPALDAALAGLHPGQGVGLSQAGTVGNRVSFGGNSFFHRNPTATLVVVPMPGGALQAGFLVETWSQRTNQLNHSIVGGNGQVLARISQTHLGGVSSGADEPGCGSICVALRQSGPGLIV